MFSFSKFIGRLTTLILGVVLTVIGMQFYEGYSYSNELNSFLEDASIVSDLHKESSEEFNLLLEFDEINREDFENTLNKIIGNAQEAYNLISNNEKLFTGKEKDLLEISVTSWLKGLESQRLR